MPARSRSPSRAIDYLAKDYASFRRLMLDRLSVLVPDWRERNPADSWSTLVELLAYAGDHLSYFQDAVATEAYLGTARRRISVRRHARLVDYAMHEGCNARAWVYCRRSKADGRLRRGHDAADRPARSSAAGGPAGLERLLAAEALARERAAGLRDAARADAARRPQRDRLLHRGATPSAACPRARHAPRCAATPALALEPATCWSSRRSSTPRPATRPTPIRRTATPCA